MDAVSRELVSVLDQNSQVSGSGSGNFCVIPHLGASEIAALLRLPPIVATTQRQSKQGIAGNGGTIGATPTDVMAVDLRGRRGRLMISLLTGVAPSATLRVVGSHSAAMRTRGPSEFDGPRRAVTDSWCRSMGPDEPDNLFRTDAGLERMIREAWAAGLRLD